MKALSVLTADSVSCLMNGQVVATGSRTAKQTGGIGMKMWNPGNDLTSVALSDISVVPTSGNAAYFGGVHCPSGSADSLA